MNTVIIQEMFSEILKNIKKDRPDEWLNISQAAQYAKLSEQTIRRYVRLGALKVSKKTGRLLFQKSNLDRWLNG
jgi:hypothetical protein